jgi:hypothetical protein
VTVTEARMGWGEFELNLRDDTPGKILDQIRLKETPAAYGLVRVYPGRVGSDSIKAGAAGLFAGVYTHRPSMLTMHGYSVTSLLGEASDGKVGSDETGPLHIDASTQITGTKTITQWVDAACDDTGSSLRRGTVTSGLAAGTTKNATLRYMTPKTILDRFVCPWYHVQYRVNPDLTVDVGPAEDLWPSGSSTTPLAVRDGSRDLNVTDLSVTALDMDEDYREWCSDVVAISGIVPGDATLAALPFGSPDRIYGETGKSMLWRRKVTYDGNDDTPTTGEMDDYAEAILNTQTGRQRTVTLSSDEFAFTEKVEAGALIQIWDPARGFFDQTNETIYGGRPIWPVRLRVTAVTWPIREGMSVWFDNRANLASDASGDPLDLTPYIEWEDDETSVTVGAPPRTLGSRKRR